MLEYQARFKQRVKSILFRGGLRPTVVRYGPSAGVVLHLDPLHHLQIEWGVYEIEVNRMYQRAVKPGIVCFDVGAAFGDSALLMSALAPDGLVWAFEPDAEMCRRFNANMALNPSLSGRIRIMPLFVGDVDHGKTRSLDGLIADGAVSVPGFVKIDVDGAEHSVLRGCASMMRDVGPPMLIEVHGRDQERECLNLLSRSGYQSRVIRNAWWRHFLPEYRPIGHNRWIFGSKVFTGACQLKAELGPWSRVFERVSSDDGW